MLFGYEPAQYVKAIIGGAIALTGAIATGYVSEGLTQAEVWLAISTGIGGFGLVFGVPNK